MKKVKIAVLISGGGSNLQALIDEIHNKDLGGKIVLVVSSREDAYGITRAKENNIDARVINSKQYSSSLEYEKTLLESLEKAKVDLIVLAGYLSFVPSAIISAYRNRIINIHPSLIPSFCGKGFYGERVHQEVINKGVKLSGATVHFVDEEMDGGPIIIQRAVEVDFNDDAQALQKKVLEIEHEILPLAIKLFIENRLRVIGKRVEVMK